MKNIVNAEVAPKGKVRDIKTFEMVHEKTIQLATDLETEAKNLMKSIKLLTVKSVATGGSRGAKAQIEDLQEVAKWLDAQATDLQKALSVLRSTLA